ncbi:hypothetical protein [Streptomyces virginiae]|uniref:hypothetical protein n=1 Tax=Streptomyces virginiae TaxID=1961 RepID=UPI00224D64B4|nr:hypothetical protein [Streptomyces virginiae]MCX5175419.1 hypothetical protein [Streptomyces virginiae]
MTPRHPLTPGRAGAASAALALVLASAATGSPVSAAGGEGADVPQGTVAYRSVAQFTTAGKPRDLLLHPDSKKLYVGSDDLPETADVNESGLHVLDPADGTVRSTVGQAPGPTGTLGRRAVRQLLAPLPGDGAVFSYPLRGIGTAKDGDAAAAGAWVPGATVTHATAGLTPSTVLVAQGPVLSEVDIATAAVRRSVTLEGGDGFAVDAARGTVWFTDIAHRRMYRIDAASFQVTATVELPAGEGFGGFTEVDSETGAVWVGLDSSVVVHDATGKRLGSLRGAGTDMPRAAAFDATTHQAFVVWQDAGDSSQPGSDNDGTLTVHRIRDLQEVAKPVVLPGLHVQLGSAAVAVEPGGASVFVSDPVAGRITRLERATSPRVTRSPADRSAAAGTEVSLTAEAEGVPRPTVVWQVSTDAGRTWQAVAGATSPTYTFTAALSDSGRRYRAEFGNDAGVGRTAAATLTVTIPDPTTGGSGGGPSTTGGTGITDGTGSSGPTGSAGSTTGGSDGGADGASGTPGSVGGGSTGATVGGGNHTTPSGGALASTGATVATLAGSAVALTAAGWALLRRTRPRSTG